MIDRDRYVPDSDPRVNDTTTWNEHYSGDYEPPVPECSSHHTYRETVPVDQFQIWICPHCGRYSDTHAPHSGGRHLTVPTDVDPEKVLIVIGHAHIPPDPASRDQFGDGTVDAALVATPYAARDDIKSFRDDVEWSPGTGGTRHDRRWVPEWKVWAVRRSLLTDFIDHMDECGWIVNNLIWLRSMQDD